MLFSIDEDGNIDINNNKNSFSDFIIGDESETNFRLARTILITHLIHKKWLKDNFILYKRINYTDEQINSIIKSKINELFENYPNLKNTVEFSFSLKDNILNIVFYKKHEGKDRILLLKDINIG